MIPPNVGGKAIAGAIARIDMKNNRSRKSNCASSPVEFGDWDDWDNGHSDGPTD